MFPSIRVCLNCPWKVIVPAICPRIFYQLIILREAAIDLKLTSYLLIFAVLIIVMVLQSLNPASKSSRLLPTPTRETIQDNADPFVGQSYYPLPYPLTIILKGSHLSNLLSWDISVSPKQVKLKLEWATSSDDSSCPLIADFLPNIILQAIKFYNIIQPSWLISTAKNKMLTKIEWQISQSKLNVSSSYSPTSNTTLSLNKAHEFQTPSPQNFQNLSDSGFESLNSNRRIHSDCSNWRRSINVPPNPSFDSPRLISHQHDIYVTPKVKDVKVSTYSSKSSSTEHLDLEKSSSPAFVLKSKSINDKPVTSKLQGKTPKVTPNAKDDKASSNPLKNSPNDLHTSSKSPLPVSAQEIKTTKNPNTSNSQGKIQNQNINPIADQFFSSKTSSSTPTPAHDDSSLSKDTSIAAASSTECPIPPKGFPKTFLEPPNPLPIVGDGFLNLNTAAYFMNISGCCCLCNKTASSHLIDHHLMLCSGLDRNIHQEK